MTVGTFILREERMSFAQFGMGAELLRPIFGEAKMDGVELGRDGGRVV